LGSDEARAVALLSGAPLELVFGALTFTPEAAVP